MSIVKPPATMSIAVVNAGHTMPMALLTKLADENESAFGMVVRTKKNIDHETYATADLADSKEERLSFLKEINENTKEHWRMFCFSNFQKEFDPDEIQPTVIIRDKKTKEPILTVAVEGDWPKYTDNDESWSESFNLIDSWLGPKIEATLQLAGGSHQKLIEYLNGAQFEKDLRDQTGHRGVVGIMAPTGMPVLIGINELGLKSTWGSCSNVYGYTEAVLEAGTVEPAAAPEKRKSKYSNTEENPTQPAPASLPAQFDPKPDAIAAAAAKFDISYEERKPADNLHGKALKAWYRSAGGDLPKNWADRPSVRVEVRRSKPQSGDAVADTSIAALMAANEQGESLPIISKEDVASINAFMKKHLGDGSAVIDDPVKAAEDESRVASFSQLFASSGHKNVQDFLRWRTSFIFAMPERAMRLAFIDLRQAYGALLEAGDKKLGELAKAGGSTTTESTTSSKSETPGKRVSKYANG